MTGQAGPLLGIDYGRRRIGVAISDGLGISASELGFVPRESDDKAAAIIVHLAKEQQAKGLVLGLPLHASGEAGKNVQWVQAFKKQLQARTALPIFEVDERYSSSEAEEELRSQGDWPVPPGRVDARSACILLRRFFAGER